ncbi:MAG: TIGR02679 domain-containing protein, partial [Solirubrobacteraceae bacterium MAG38_C4-C5]|nr:TIGR02679 domain-containing protein [Candidatus Siliceabacter maunaloa]
MTAAATPSGPPTAGRRALPAAAEPGLDRLLGLAAQRLEGSGLRPSGRLRVRGVTADEVRWLSGLLGARWRAVLPGADASVDLAALDAALRASALRCSLAEAAAQAAGRPLVDRPARRAAA